MRYKVDKCRINDRGFTLVELLIAVALVAVVGSAVFGFMTVGARTFSSTSSEVNLQSESQLAFNQMQDLIIDTAIGIDYGYAPDGTTDVFDYTNYTWEMDDTAFPSDFVAKKMVMYNLDKIYELTWVVEEEKLYYTEFSAHDSSGTVVRNNPASPDDGPALMAEYMTDFKVDLNLMTAKRIVRIDTTYDKGGKEYTSSHNITLRNRPLSGNSIPAYVTPSTDDEPEELVGRSDVYLKPGERLDLSELPIVKSGDIKDKNGNVLVNASEVDSSKHKGYIIRYNETTGHRYRFKEVEGPQHVRFAIRAGQADCYSTIDPDGLLIINPAQEEDFRVTVTGDVSIYTVVKEVNIHIIRVTSVSVNFIPDNTKAVDEGGTVSENGLKEKEEFDLEATVNAKNGDEVSDKSGAGVSYAVTWAVTAGKGRDMVEVGTANGPDASHMSKCRFKIKEDTVTASNLDIQISATSNESVVLGYKRPSGANAPVIGWFNGKTYKKPEDPHKKFEEKDGSGLKRGQEYVVNLSYTQDGQNNNPLEKHLKLKDGQNFNFGPGMIKVVDIIIEETVYDLSGKKSTRDIYQEAKDRKDIRIEDGTSWKFYSPAWYNPNATYRYRIEHSVYKHPTDATYWNPAQNFMTTDDLNALYMSTKGEMPKESDRLASGTVLDTTFPRMKLTYYTNDSTPANFNIKNASSADSRAMYYPRSFNTQTPPKTFTANFTFDSSFDLSNGAYSESLKGLSWKQFKYYKPNASGEYVYGINSDPKEANKADSSSCTDYEKSLNNNFIQVSSFGNPVESAFGKNLPGFQIQFDGYSNSDGKKEWKDLESELRMVPVVTIDRTKTGDGKGAGPYDGDYVLFDSYIEMHNHDITIPSTGAIGKIINDLTGTSATDEVSYFPLPGDYNFPGETGTVSKVGGRWEWKDAKEWVGACCKYHLVFFNYPDTMYYTLTKNNGTSKWELTLFAEHGSGSMDYYAFKRYTCGEGDNKWNNDNSAGYDNMSESELPLFRKTL